MCAGVVVVVCAVRCAAEGGIVCVALAECTSDRLDFLWWEGVV